MSCKLGHPSPLPTPACLPTPAVMPSVTDAPSLGCLPLLAALLYASRLASPLGPTTTMPCSSSSPSRGSVPAMPPEAPPVAPLGWGLLVALTPVGASAPVAAVPGVHRPAMAPVELLLLLLLGQLCRGRSR